MSRKLLVGSGLAGAGILAAVFGSSAPKLVYARSVSDFVAHPIYDQTVRVAGFVVPDSLCRREHPCEYDFRLSDQQSQLSVRYPSCVVPDTFRIRPGVDLPVTAEGKLCTNCHRFQASRLFARGSGKYEAKRLDAATGSPPELFRPIPECSGP